MADTLAATLARVRRRWQRADDLRIRKFLGSLGEKGVFFLIDLVNRHGRFWEHMDRLTIGELIDLRDLLVEQTKREAFKN